MNNFFSVAGKIAVVTGGSSGIGAMIARGFVENGVKTYITSRKLEQLEQTATELSSLGECIAVQSDLSTMAGVEAFAEEMLKREPKIDILINNAGAAWGAPVEEFPESGWDKVMDLNVKSIFFLSQRLLPALRLAGDANEPSRIVNIASVNGLTHPHMNNYSYSASKAAVIQLTRHMAADIRPTNVNINAIAPGFFPSKMTKHALAHEQEIMAGLPARKVGELADVAGTAIYLCSKASNYVCGHTVVLDGGQVANAG
ncbi:Rhamnolipids biosynthesis 3-oxoacyl-[acyl-carrier-protein] reductase [Paraglaciecola mesophila]|uniref:Rhamnolipids biosynthesis 3-oxoacyl-[acyl-carrier-protein] reductase n=1 Tax=Paraglaciecola mesophila TaxID=197222 RepID=A0A857JJB6_9ALTE|nr:SDR family NAD(P)-dependent oxidoreductase [Paraglaciecola mesophila]QHJ11057.1 Rhamnolipids biosynthesis 3-oxoacyl-[acyl-carrier-protein] reductase [Paraglaciecola mesophila]